MRDRYLTRVVVILSLTLVAFGIIHDPPRAARAQGSGSPAARSMGDVWNVAPSISQGIFSTPLLSIACVDSLHQSHIPSVMRIGVSLKVAGVLYVTETSGIGAAAVTQTTALNGATSIPANQDFTFVREIRSTSDLAGTIPIQFNFVLGTNGGVNYLRVTECLDGVD